MVFVHGKHEGANVPMLGLIGLRGGKHDPSFMAPAENRVIS